MPSQPPTVVFVGIELGFLTAGVPDPESAREVFNSIHPELVIVDYALAPQGHRRLAYYVRTMSRYPQTPLLAIVERAASVGREALAEGFDDICSRPIDPEILLAKVRHLIRHDAEPPSDPGADPPKQQLPPS